MWDENKRDFVKLTLMNKNQISLWIDNYMNVGSHTSDHKNLINLDHNEKILQIVDPKKYFNEVFKVDVKTFSYPFGAYDNESFKVFNTSLELIISPL